MISGVVICLNEQELIEQCIRQLWWVNEIIVIDGGSDDNTINKLNSLKTIISIPLKVFRFPFTGHFGDQKNLGISMTSHEWVFVLDADETLEPNLIDELKSIAIPYNIYDAVAIPRKNYIDGVETPVYPDLQFRFFRAFCRFIYPIHEELIGFRKLYTAKNHLLHYKSSDRYNNQQEHYIKIAEQIYYKFRQPGEDWK
jgi:glycosyltransferase involved in cell wall biosynthesis